MGLPLRSTYTNDRMKPYETQRKSQEQERNLKKDSRLELITKNKEKKKEKETIAPLHVAPPKWLCQQQKLSKRTKKLRKNFRKTKR